MLFEIDLCDVLAEVREDEPLMCVEATQKALSPQVSGCAIHGNVNKTADARNNKICYIINCGFLPDVSSDCK